MRQKISNANGFQIFDTDFEAIYLFCYLKELLVMSQFSFKLTCGQVKLPNV